MKRIANQFWVVVQETAKLIWLIICEITLLFRHVGLWLYARRWQIARHKATPWALVLVAALWSVWAMYHYSQQRRQPVAMPPVSDSAFRQQHFLLTGQPPAPEASKNLAYSIYSWLGVPHRDGGDNRRGTDCSGFVRNVYREAYGIALSRNAQKMYDNDVETIDREALREGDLVFFNTFGGGISHVGIYLQNGRFAHASTSRGVTVDSLINPYYAKGYYAGGRVRESRNREGAFGN